MLQLFRDAQAWCEDNTAKRKTVGGMQKFLGGWIKRQADGDWQGKMKWNGRSQNARPRVVIPEVRAEVC
jgi:hypothetical protein